MTLNEYLESKGITPRAFAESIGLSESYISLIRNGKRPAGRKAALTIHAGTNGAVPLSELMSTKESAVG